MWRDSSGSVISLYRKRIYTTITFIQRSTSIVFSQRLTTYYIVQYKDKESGTVSYQRLMSSGSSGSATSLYSGWTWNSRSTPCEFCWHRRKLWYARPFLPSLIRIGRSNDTFRWVWTTICFLLWYQCAFLSFFCINFNSLFSSCCLFCSSCISSERLSHGLKFLISTADSIRFSLNVICWLIVPDSFHSQNRSWWEHPGEKKTILGCALVKAQLQTTVIGGLETITGGAGSCNKNNAILQGKTFRARNLLQSRLYPFKPWSDDRINF